MAESTKDARRRLRLVRERAEELARDVTAAETLVDQAWKKAERYSGKFDTLRNDLFALMRMVRASYSRSYTAIPWASLVTAMAALFYFWNPFDAVPDFVMGAGLIDDATVLALALRSLRGDLKAFQEWENTQDESSSEDSGSQGPLT